MMGLDAARVADPIVKINNPGEGLVSARKQKKAKDKPHHPPVFSSEEHDLKIQVPEGWHTL